MIWRTLQVERGQSGRRGRFFGETHCFNESQRGYGRDGEKKGAGTNGGEEGEVAWGLGDRVKDEQAA